MISSFTCGYTEELAACSSSEKARLCWNLTVLNSSLMAKGDNRFMAAKRWPITGGRRELLLNDINIK